MIKIKFHTYLFLLLLISGWKDLNAQKINWFFHVDGGASYSWIEAALNAPDSYQHQPGFAWTYGGGVQVLVAYDIYLRAGMDYVRLKEFEISSDIRRIPLASGANPFFKRQYFSEIRSSYFAFPLSIKLGGRTAGLSLGYQFMFSLQDYRINKEKTSDPEDVYEADFIFSEPYGEPQKNEIDLGSKDEGLFLGLHFRLNPNLSLRINTLIGVKPIEYTMLGSDRRTLRQIRLYTLGLSYFW